MDIYSLSEITENVASSDHSIAEHTADLTERREKSQAQRQKRQIGIDLPQEADITYSAHDAITLMIKAGMIPDVRGKGDYTSRSIKVGDNDKRLFAELTGYNNEDALIKALRPERRSGRERRARDRRDGLERTKAIDLQTQISRREVVLPQGVILSPEEIRFIDTHFFDSGMMNQEKVNAYLRHKIAKDKGIDLEIGEGEEDILEEYEAWKKKQEEKQKVYKDTKEVKLDHRKFIEEMADTDIKVIPTDPQEGAGEVEIAEDLVINPEDDDNTEAPIQYQDKYEMKDTQELAKVAFGGDEIRARHFRNRYPWYSYRIHNAYFPEGIEGEDIEEIIVQQIDRQYERVGLNPEQVKIAKEKGWMPSEAKTKLTNEDKKELEAA